MNRVKQHPSRARSSRPASSAGTVDAAREYVNHAATTVGRKLTRAKRQIKTLAHDGYDRVSDGVADSQRAVAAKVRKHPLMSIMTATGVGFALGVGMMIPFLMRANHGWTPRHFPFFRT